MTVEEKEKLDEADAVLGMQGTPGWKYFEVFLNNQIAYMVNDLVTYAKPLNEELWRMKGVIQGLNIAIGYFKDVHDDAQEVREKKEKENA